MADSSAYDYARKYLSIGRCVIPSGGGKDGKAALVNWKVYQTTRSSEDQLKAWQKELKPSIYAMPTGPVSSCFVVDCDNPEAANILEAAGLKPHVRTRKGMHFYCALPKWDISNSTRIMPGIDIRGAGGYVNFAGQNAHANYLINILPTNDRLIPFEKLPAELQKKLKPPEKKKPTAPTAPVSAHDNTDLMDRILKEAISRAGPGNRNETGFWLACQLRDNRFPLPEAEALMAHFAGQVGGGKGKDSYTEHEAIASLKQAYQQPAREPWKPKSSRYVKTREEQAKGPEPSINDDPTLSQLTGDRYCIQGGCICWNRQTKDGTITTPLCNFNAWLTKDIYKDDGTELTRFLRIEGRMETGEPLPEIEIPASSFMTMNWLIDKWGTEPQIVPGSTSKDHVRYCIGKLRKAVKRKIYVHTGWREIEGKMAYLTSSGALGRDDVEVELDSKMKPYNLPNPPTVDAVTAMKASLNFLNCAQKSITIPAWSAMFLAPLTEIIDSAFTVWYAGLSGSMKSTITSYALSHFGNFDEDHLYIAWRDTENELEKFLARGKDIALLIDDWPPGKNTAKTQELENKAEHIIRGQANRQGKSRMKVDTTSRISYTPRGLLISSGEQVPGGQSGNARLFVVPIKEADLDKELLKKERTNKALYKHAMAHYILWLGKNWDQAKKGLPILFDEWKDKAQSPGIHLRMARCIAWLFAGLHTGLMYAREINAIDKASADKLMLEGLKIFTDLAILQGGRVESQRPGKRFLEGVQALLNNGKCCLRNISEVTPSDPPPGVKAIGWIDHSNGHIFLDNLNAYAEVTEFYKHTNEPFTTYKDAVYEDLKNLGYIEVATEGKDKNRTSKQKWISGRNMKVLEVKKEHLGYSDQMPLMDE